MCRGCTSRDDSSPLETDFVSCSNPSLDMDFSSLAMRRYLQFMWARHLTVSQRKLSSRSTPGIQSGTQNVLLRKTPMYLVVCKRHPQVWNTFLQPSNTSVGCVKWKKPALRAQRTGCTVPTTYKQYRHQVLLSTCTWKRRTGTDSFKTDQMLSHRRICRVRYLVLICTAEENSTPHLVCGYLALTQYILSTTSITKAFL